MTLLELPCNITIVPGARIYWRFYGKQAVVAVAKAALFMLWAVHRAACREVGPPAYSESLSRALPTSAERILALDIDFNWNVPGPRSYINSYAPPGLWAGASPRTHADWYARMGANVAQSFAVSGDGYAWYFGSVVPPQPGLTSDFLTELVALLRARGIGAFGYFNACSNTHWGRAHPDLSYGTPAACHIPFTRAYVDFLAASVADALARTGMDGFMLDWLWPVPAAVRAASPTGGAWLPAERELYAELSGEPFPGEANLTAAALLAYERAAVGRLWAAVVGAARAARPGAVVWLSTNNISSGLFADSAVYREADWVMDESGDPARLRAALPRLGPRTRPVLCLSWAGVAAAAILADPANADLGLYGFAGPASQAQTVPMCADEYLRRPAGALDGVAGNMAALTRFYRGLPPDYVNASLPADCPRH